MGVGVVEEVEEEVKENRDGVEGTMKSEQGYWKQERVTVHGAFTLSQQLPQSWEGSEVYPRNPQFDPEVCESFPPGSLGGF